MDPLPIDKSLPAIVRALGQSPNLVIVAPPGAGKTTRVPVALVEAGLVAHTLILLQPRRVAARAAARRIAEENGWTLGKEVGYQVRFDRAMTESTKIQIVTEGILTRRLQGDPLLDGVDAVLLDEFHLRSLEGDLGLALLRDVQSSVRPDLRLIVMSATLDTGPVAAFLGDCPVIASEGKLFPIDIEYEPQRQRDPPQGRRTLPERVARAVRHCLDTAGKGHVLVFLPGMGEIERCRAVLDTLPGVDILRLHGSLSTAEQDGSVRPRSERAVILATNVAETSLTIDGVTAVVDSGLVRLNFHDARSGLDRLDMERVSADSAAQRAGRAGRTAPGRVFRLWTRGEQKELLARTPPEIERVDLCGTVLELFTWGVDPFEFDWFEPPEKAAVTGAVELLTELGALDEAGAITSLGRALTRLPLHPRLGRLLFEAHARGFVAEGAMLAALLSERDPLRAERQRRRTASGRLHRTPDRPTGPSDILLRFELVAGRTPTTHADRALDKHAVLHVRRVAKEIQKAASAAFGRSPVKRPTDDDLLRLLFVAFPDRLVKRRARGDDRGVMVGGRGVRLSERSVVRDAMLFVALELDGAQADARVNAASAVSVDWLDLEEETRLHFDRTQEQVVARRYDLYGDLCIGEHPVPADRAAALEILLKEASVDPINALRPPEEALRFMTRVECLRRWMPDLGLRAMDEGALAAMLPDVVGRTVDARRPLRSFADLRLIDLLARLKSALTYEQLSALDRFAPGRLPVPSGAAIRLVYEPGQRPILAVQVQHLFGLSETPTVAGGRVKVLLHLLAPSGRSVQVTDDLRSFWNNTYAQVRKDLRGRYPKHAWPEDPWTAEAEKRPRRKKK